MKKNIPILFLYFYLFLFLFWTLISSGQTRKSDDKGDNVIWTSPSENSMGSMPAGNGDIGINLWVEKNGTWSLNFGRLEIHLSKGAIQPKKD